MNEMACPSVYCSSPGVTTSSQGTDNDLTLESPSPNFRSQQTSTYRKLPSERGNRSIIWLWNQLLKEH